MIGKLWQICFITLLIYLPPHQRLWPCWGQQPVFYSSLSGCSAYGRASVNGWTVSTDKPYSQRWPLNRKRPPNIFTYTSSCSNTMQRKTLYQRCMHPETCFLEFSFFNSLVHCLSSPSSVSDCPTSDPAIVCLSLLLGWLNLSFAYWFH